MRCAMPPAGGRKTASSFDKLLLDLDREDAATFNAADGASRKSPAGAPRSSARAASCRMSIPPGYLEPAAQRLARMIVLDASVLIAHLDPRDALHDAADGAAAGRRRPAIRCEHDHPREKHSSHQLRTGTLRTTQAALKTLEVEELPLRPGAAEQLAALRAETGLKLPDCCVLLAAEADERRRA